MLKALNSVGLDILSYILAFVLSGLCIFLAGFFSDRFFLAFSVVGVICSFYFSIKLIDKLR